MARMLSSRDSSATCIDRANRHIRLCRQTSGNEPFVAAIQPAVEQLVAKETERQAALVARNNAYDDVVQADNLLDDGVRTAYEHLRQYDRENRTQTADTAFSGKSFGAIVDMPISQEPQAVLEVALRIENTGIEALQPIAATLRAKVEASKAKWTAYQEATAMYRSVLIAEEHVKAELCKQYEANWFNARMSQGKIAADRLFPRVQSAAGAAKDEVNAAEPASGAAKDKVSAAEPAPKA